MRAGSILRGVFAASLGLALHASTSWATWSHDPYENNFVVTNGSNDPWPYDVVPDDAGGAFVLHGLNTLTEFDVYLEHVVDGANVWAAPVPVCTATGQQNRPVGVLDGAGGLYVCWGDGRNGVANFDVFLQRIDSNGLIHSGWPVNGFSLSTHAQGLRPEGSPSVVSDGAGGVLVFWTLLTLAGDEDVYGARVTGNHTVLWVGPLASGATNQELIDAIPTADGGAIVAFKDGPLANHALRILRCGPTGALAWGGIRDVCTTSTSQGYEHLCPDAAGGAFVVWHDGRSGNKDVYAQRIAGSDGSRAIGWFVDGNPVATGTSAQQLPVAVEDGNQGLFVAWTDDRNGNQDVYAQHLLPQGVPFVGWATNGIPISQEALDQSTTFRGIASDGNGGMLLAWNDSRYAYPYNDLFAIRITGNGTVPATWIAGGTPMTIASGNQADPLVVSDGAGGLLGFWDDIRIPAEGQVYGQRIDRFGVLGNAEPRIVAVADVLADQGGHVRLDWEPSWLDSDPDYAIGAYWIWRQVPAATAMRAVRQGARLHDERTEAGQIAEPAAGERLFRLAANASYAWEYVASRPATGFPLYSYVATTTTDSTATSNPVTYFMVEARWGGAGVAFWDSAPDSGWSVDNLAPATPAPFTAFYASGHTQLDWGGSTEADFSHYRLHRGTVEGYRPTGANLIAEPTTAGYVDPHGGFYYYKVAAVDVHGNVSGYASAFPGATTDVPVSAARFELRLDGMAPSPMRQTCAVRFELPVACEAALAIFDSEGRRVSELAHGVFAAGPQSLRWNGSDLRGSALPAGIYFLQLRAAGRRLVTRFVKLE